MLSTAWPAPITTRSVISGAILDNRISFLCVVPANGLNNHKNSSGCRKHSVPHTEGTVDITAVDIPLDTHTHTNNAKPN